MKKAANDQSYFAKIAAENMATRPGLAECPPLEFAPLRFTPTKQLAPPAETESFDSLCADYHNEIARLRGQYAPFLRDLTPKAKICRKRDYIDSFDFRFETEQDRADFARVQSGKGEWEKVTLPHYHGPVGRWTAFYRAAFRYFPSAGKRVRLHFLGADYIANVYLNGRFVGSHEGMFSPFSFDVTQVVRRGANTLLVELKNDLPTTGIEGDRVDGNKIYAATGIGWDDPQVGWHHCPPGGGIYNKVYLEQTGDYNIESVFMRPDIDSASAEAWVQVNNATDDNYSERNSSDGLKLGIKIYPRNFEGRPGKEIAFENIPYTGPGINYYTYRCAMKNFRLWQQDAPYLYTARVSLYDRDGVLLDQLDQVFGMRKFAMITDREGDKGDLELNNKPILLRGANDMGHMQLAVCNGDFELLIKDILIAKTANMNFYRFTQRPVQEEIYLYCDMLGMLNQTDLPLFATVRRNQYHEAVRQCGEMERLIRNHPSTIMVTYINESVNVEAQGRVHRHLGRPELESFFESCDRAIRLENPDRVVKRDEGDYDPPTTEGLSDFHCYNMWYTNHALPVGRLYKNWLPAIRIGWKTGCGEYGAEGLDSYRIMTERYPKNWLPDADGSWLSDRIVNSQTNTMHGDWYEEQEGIHNWIAESQRHQAWATRLMTDALRRRSDKVVSFAIHLLIDAWPAGWMKVLVGVDREPKPAFFEFRHSLNPLRNNLRCDRFTGYCGQTLKIENWLLNDLQTDCEDLKTVITARCSGRVIASAELTDRAAACSAKLSGIFELTLPQTDDRQAVILDSALYRNGELIHAERFPITVFARRSYAKPVICVGIKAARAAEALRLEYTVSSRIPNNAEALLLSDNTADASALKALADSGCKVIILYPDSGTDGYEIAGKKLTYNYIFNTYDETSDGGARGFDCERGVAFIARDSGDPMTAEFLPQDFAYFYNADKDFIDTAAVNYIQYGGEKELLYAYAKPGFFEKTKGHKRRLPVAARLDKNLFAVSFSYDGRLGLNPVADRFMLNLLGKE